MGRRLEYEVKTSVRLNMSNPQHVKINDVIQNLDPKIFKSKNQFIIDAIQFYIDNYGKETFVIKKKEKERAEYIRSEDIDDIKEEVIEAATNEARVTINRTERNAYIPFGKLAGLEYVYSFLAFSASVTSKKEIKQHEKRTGYFNNKQQSDGGERHEEQIHSL